MAQHKTYPATRLLILALNFSGAVVAVGLSVWIAYSLHSAIAWRFSDQDSWAISVCAGLVCAFIAYLPFRLIAEALAIMRDVAMAVARLTVIVESVQRSRGALDPATEDALRRLSMESGAG